MQKVTKKIFGWVNALRQKAALELYPAEMEFIVLSCGPVSNGNMHLIPPEGRSFTCASYLFYSLTIFPLHAKGFNKKFLFGCRLFE
jgi:hypothetical protein